MQRFVQLPGHIIAHRAEQRPDQIFLKASRFEILGNQSQRFHPDRHVADLRYWGAAVQKTGLRRKRLSQLLNKTGSFFLFLGEGNWIECNS
jgi:hypothetical protein